MEQQPCLECQKKNTQLRVLEDEITKTADLVKQLAAVSHENSTKAHKMLIIFKQILERCEKNPDLIDLARLLLSAEDQDSEKCIILKAKDKATFDDVIEIQVLTQEQIERRNRDIIKLTVGDCC